MERDMKQIFSQACRTCIPVLGRLRKKHQWDNLVLLREPDSPYYTARPCLKNKSLKQKHWILQKNIKNS